MNGYSNLVAEQNLQFQGIRHATNGNNEGELFKAYLDFAYYHLKNAAEMYENAATVLQLQQQKALFSQLACRKREVISKLRLNGYDTPADVNSTGRSGVSPFTRYLMDVELTPLMTRKEAFDFAYGKETKTLAIYEKLAGTAHLFSIKLLFNYLLESQRQHLVYLDTQMAISNGDLERLIPAELELEYARG